MSETDVHGRDAELMEQEGRGSVLQWLAVAALIYLLICAVGLIGDGFGTASGDRARELFEFASNPFAALVVGTVATALIQSSSTVTVDHRGSRRGRAARLGIAGTDGHGGQYRHVDHQYDRLAGSCPREEGIRARFLRRDGA